MEKIFDTTLQNRKLLYKILDNTSREQLLEIPTGFRNNIWWNIAHVVATQQILVYKFSGLKMRIPEQFIEKFKKGTVPDGSATDAEIKEIGDFLISTAEWAKQDYESGLFKDFNTYTTSVNVTLNSVEDAMTFNVFHEDLHLGTILGLQKAVNK
ncbi:DinB superfamily protein [Pricia antarctica]|uniref:DinB superfamily protein n=1 Tax=Pricia antarctica TaxID=641691 RepID=A0A1G6WMI6_9FLAO|nr:DinB family protein [Pricia antarctica]SDD66427.1 DinB superfamily protein [Pricia antarctica]